jgi:hypothetical protein
VKSWLKVSTAGHQHDSGEMLAVHIICTSEGLILNGNPGWLTEWGLNTNSKLLVGVATIRPSPLIK